MGEASGIENITEGRWNAGVETAWLANEAYDDLVEAREDFKAILRLIRGKPLGVEIREEGFEAAALRFAAATQEFRDYDNAVGLLVGRCVVERVAAGIMLSPTENEKDYAYQVSGQEGFSSDIWAYAFK